MAQDVLEKTHNRTAWRNTSRSKINFWFVPVVSLYKHRSNLLLRGSKLPGAETRQQMGCCLLFVGRLA